MSEYSFLSKSFDAISYRLIKKILTRLTVYEERMNKRVPPPNQLKIRKKEDRLPRIDQIGEGFVGKLGRLIMRLLIISLCHGKTNLLRNKQLNQFKSD